MKMILLFNFDLRPLDYASRRVKYVFPKFLVNLENVESSFSRRIQNYYFYSNN